MNFDTDPKSLAMIQANHARERYQELEEMLEFTSEEGKLDSHNLAIKIKLLKKVLFYTPPNELTLDKLCEAEATLEKLYNNVVELIQPISILTLRATSDKYAIKRPFWKAIFLGSSSVGRNFFRQLFWVAMFLISLICIRKLTTLPTNDPFYFVDPFLYGALGALIYIYKNISSYYTKRLLHPKKLATNWLRIFMGALTGALVVNLFSGFLNDINLAPIAIGFLAGYSVEFFYQILDKAISMIIPDKNNQDNPTIRLSPRQAQIETLTKQLQELDNEDDKATIRNLLEKMY